MTFTKISSRTMHIPWDTAGCLCPVGDFFNYAPPEDNPSHLNNSKAFGTHFFSDEAFTCEEESLENSTEDPLDANADRLTDAGYDEAVASYCFYAKKNYGKGDQVLLTCCSFFTLSDLGLQYNAFCCPVNIKLLIFAHHISGSSSSILMVVCMFNLSCNIILL